MEYQETMNLDIENISITDQQFWRSINEVIDDSYFGVVTLFSKIFLNQCKSNLNENITSKNNQKEQNIGLIFIMSG